MAISVRFENPFSPPQLPTVVEGEVQGEPTPKKEAPLRLQFDLLPISWVPYRLAVESTERNHYTSLRVIDEQTKKTHKVYLERESLQTLGLSLSLWDILSKKQPHLLPELLDKTQNIHTGLSEAVKMINPYLARRYLGCNRIMRFVPKEKIPLLTKAICRTITCDVPPLRVSAKQSHLPVGFSIFKNELSYEADHVVIDIKKSHIGEGSSCKVKTAWWLNGMCLVAKKILFRKNGPHSPARELEALKRYRGKTGIISYICADFINGKWIVVLPYFNDSLSNFLESPHSYSMKQRLSIARQLLEGVANIAKEGINGDIKPDNVLMREGENGEVEAVFSDFGGWQPDSRATEWFITPNYSPPEYYKVGEVTKAHDVWGAGIVLYALLAGHLPKWFSRIQSEKAIKTWLGSLDQGWIRKAPKADKIPPFALDIIDAMLHPNPEQRATGQEAFERFRQAFPED